MAVGSPRENLESAFGGIIEIWILFEQSIGFQDGIVRITLSDFHHPTPIHCPNGYHTVGIH